MVCLSAEELQARLALRALWKPAREELEDAALPGTSSILYKTLRAEVDDVLRSSHKRRAQRLEHNVQRLQQSGSIGAAALQENGEPEVTTNGSSHDPMVDEAVQTNLSGETIPSSKLATSFEKAMTTQIKAQRPPNKRFGPTSKQQFVFTEPPLKPEKIERETTTLQMTLSAIEQNLGSRHRQINSLGDQLEACKKELAQAKVKSDGTSETLRTLKQEPNGATTVHASRLRKKKENLENLVKSLDKTKDERKRNEALTKQQHAYLTQTELLYRRGGLESINKFPAGDVFLTPAPLPVDDDGVEVWDVGTAHANPYTVDSWPFEPNVLARRCPQEGALDSLREETHEDLLEAKMPPMRLPLNTRHFVDDDDDDDDDYAGPSATSRSL